MTSRFLTPFQSPSRSLTGLDPFTDLHREMNRLFDDFLGAGPAAGGALMSVPRLDVREDSQEICVCAELPGVKPQDVDLRVEGHVLTLRGEKRDESDRRQEDMHLMERSFGRFQRTLQLPYAPDPDQVRAEFADGVLTIHLPKQPQQERSRRIAIEGQPASAQPTPAGGTEGGGMSHH